MLRTLTPHPNESELVRLCHQKSWTSALGRCQSHPGEAAPTDACLRGAGGTALAVAVRGGAPRILVEALLAANPHQVVMTNKHRGTVLHEGLRHWCSDEVLGLLLTAALEYQASSSPSGIAHSRREEGHQHHTFKHVSVQEHRFLRYPNLLGATDDMNRTVLHLLVERARRLASNNRRSDETFGFFRTVLAAHPEVVQAKDVDGHTPLLLLLLSPRGPVVGGAVENDICRIARLMLAVSPGASSVEKGHTVLAGAGSHPESRRLVRRGHSSSPRAWKLSVRRGSSVKSSSTVAPLPLYYAILHGRSLETIQLLLSDHRTALGQPAGSLLVTNMSEVLLHVAVTTRAPTSVLYQLVNDCPEAVAYPDAWGLTSLDWTWIRHCLDCPQSRGDASAIPTTRIISRRRLVPGDFADRHQRSLQNVASIASGRIAAKYSPPAATASSNVEPSLVSSLASASSPVPQNPVALRSQQEELLRRINLLVPVAASTRAGASTATRGDAECLGIAAQARQNPALPYPFSLLHAVCYVPCPNAFVHVALALDPPSIVEGTLRSRDAFQGRLPLHYAASRRSRAFRVPTGVTSSNLPTIHEGSVVALVAAPFPEACRVTDRSGQLPLHVVIDTYKDRLSHRRQGGQPRDCEASVGDEMATSDNDEDGGMALDSDESNDEMVVEGLEVTRSLLGHFPGALERRDGRTGLFPWQQAGVASADRGVVRPSSRRALSTTLVYALLRYCPTAGFASADASRPSQSNLAN